MYGAKHITTSLPETVYLDIKKRGWSFREILLHGYDAKLNQPNLVLRIKESDEKIDKLSKRLAYYIGRLEEQDK